MTARPKRPRDPNQRAYLIGQIATGEIEDADPNAGKNPHAVALGRLGGLKGGRARAEKLDAKQKFDIAVVAAMSRWKLKKRQPN